jgi:desulfoferrodoxin (superoxide reductase-like protein)
MSIALPVSQPGAVPHNDPRHYTEWAQVKAPQQIVATPVNPIPEDPGTIVPHAEKHYTEWVPK